MATQAQRHLNLVTRSTPEALAPLRQTVMLDTLLNTILDTMADPALILNRDRQILAANKALTIAFGFGDSDDLLGRRPGELLQCLFAEEGPDGCGTGLHCTVCGAFRTVLESQELETATSRECRVTLDDGTALDLQINCTPLSLHNLQVTLCILKDISAEKRRSVLEKVFFHDVMNTIGSIRNIAHAFNHAEMIKPDREPFYRQLMVDLAEKLIDEIAHQRKLLAAEQGDFAPSLGMISTGDLMHELYGHYLSNEIGQPRQLVLGEVADCWILSDCALLRRIVGNMVKNALEATGTEDFVTMRCRDLSDSISFEVHNPGAIPTDVQLQLFQRSFSTKEGEGRGIGTYSMKLFGEKYLKGKVSFVSSEAQGTTFTFTVPKKPPD